MKLAFFGTPEFAVPPLARLLDDGFNVACVFTQPDKPSGRGNRLTPPPVKVYADGRVPVYQPDTLKDGAAVQILRELDVDLAVTVAYGKLFPPELLAVPEFGCVNIHASLLPKYRGAAPIQRAVLNGEHETGVMSMYMAEEMDAGDIILARRTDIGEYETSGELFARLSVLGADVLSETVRMIKNGTVTRTPQNHAQATFAPPIRKDEAAVNWAQPARTVVNHVRGMNPSPVATAEFGGVTLKIHTARVADGSGAPGTVLNQDKNGLTVACSDGAVVITEVQAPGGKRMNAADYFRGHPVC